MLVFAMAELVFLIHHLELVLLIQHLNLVFLIQHLELVLLIQHLELVFLIQHLELVFLIQPLELVLLIQHHHNELSYHFLEIVVGTNEDTNVQIGNVLTLFLNDFFHLFFF